MKKRLLSMLLVLAMMVGMLATMPISIGAASDIWNGSTASSFAGGDGTEGNPYQIANGAQLALMSKKITVDKDGNYNRAHYVLTDDIVLNDFAPVSEWYDNWYNDEGDYPDPTPFTPIGKWENATSSFGGTFDGQGHTITGAYFYAETGDNHGFFGAVQGGAVIKNFALVNSLFGNEGGNIAAIAGTTDRSSEDDILVENVYIDAYVYSGGANAGGVFGTLSNTQDGYNAGTVTISRVTFVGRVDATNYAAGLIADARNVIFDVDDCLVYADIKATAGQYSAGFVSRSNNNLSRISQYDQVVTGCILAGGSVNATKSTRYNRAYISTSNATSKPLAEYCYNAISGLSTMRNADTTNDAPSADIAKAELYGNYVGETDVNWSVMTNWARPTYDIARPKGIAESFEIEPLASLKGSGTQESPYKISSAADLSTVATLSSTDTFAGKYFELTNDIVLTGENNHSPIGSWGCAFGGIFDGQGYTISGLHMVANGDGYGFFAAIQGGAEIKNLKLVDAYVEGTGAGTVGALVGQTNRGNEDDITIENVYVDATVKGNGNEVAALIGNLSDTQSSYEAGVVNITNVTVAGSVSGKNHVAGIVGNARNVGVNITNCLVAATVNGTGSYVAGIMARGKSDLSLANAGQYVAKCLVVSTEISTTASTKYNRSYVSAEDGSNGSTLKPIIEYCYDALGITDAQGCENASSEDISRYALYGKDAERQIDWAEWGAGNWVTKTNDVPRPAGVAEAFIIAPPVFFEGEGTAANPYQISDASDLAVLSNLSQSDTFEGKYFVLTDDITLTGNNNHKPIGSWNFGFGGSFDGQGYTISGLHINKSGDGFGLFGVIQGGAVIKNFALVDAYVGSTNMGAIAAIVGQTNRGNGGDILIENIYTDATVSAKGTEVGGIIGNISNSTDTYTAGVVSINRVLFMGEVISTKGYVGGIVGNARNVTVNLSNCAFYGSVEAGGQYAAGLITGQDGSYTIESCVVAGSVKGTTDVLSIAVYRDAESVDAEGVRAITETYVLLGVGNGVTKNADAGADIIVAKSIGELFGNNLDLAGWDDRQGDLIIPDVCYAPDVIFTQEMISGASIRFDYPTGIRFSAVLGGAYLDQLLADMTESYSFGIIIAPTDYVEAAGEFTVDALDALGLDSVAYVIIPAEQIYGGSEADGYYEFRCALGQLNEYNYDRSFSAIAYVEIDGEYIYSAYNAEDNSRSIAYVAQKAYEDTNYEQNAAYPNEIADQAGVYSPYTAAQREILLGFFGQDTLDLHFLSYNVRNVEDTSGWLDRPTYEYTDREIYLRDYLVNYGADIIGLQEAASLKATLGTLNWFDVLGDADHNVGLTAAGYTCVKGADVYAEGYTSEKTMYNPIYFKTEKFNLIANGSKWFTSTPDVASTIDGANTYKNLNYVVLEDKETGKRFVYVNLHLIVQGDNNFVHDGDGNDTAFKVQQLQVIYLRSILQELQDEYDLPMFVGGDFNNSYGGINDWFKNSVVGENAWDITTGTPEETIKLSVARDTAVSKTPVIASCLGSGIFETEDITVGSKIDLWYTSNMDGFVHVYQIIDNKNTTVNKYPSDHLPAKLYVTLYLN